MPDGFLCAMKISTISLHLREILRHNHERSNESTVPTVNPAHPIYLESSLSHSPRKYLASPPAGLVKILFAEHCGDERRAPLSIGALENLQTTEIYAIFTHSGFSDSSDILGYKEDGGRIHQPGPEFLLYFLEK